MYSTEAYGRNSITSKFSKMVIQRNECGDDDVEFDILYCGICHSDIHVANNDLGTAKYPIVPGHELAGKVIKVGANVKGIKVGDKVGVGSIADSCMTCSMCNKGDEHYCENGFTVTYNGETNHGHLKTNSGYTFGGFSKRLTVHKRYAVKIPESYPLEYAGPLFCSAITMYSPLKHFGAGNGGKSVAIIGIGGLGQMGISLAAAMGNEVTAISTTPRKEATAKELGATHFIVSSDEDSMKKGAKQFDLILNTVSANHQVAHYLPLLAMDGTIVQLGLVNEPHQLIQGYLMMSRTSISGSIIGGMPETQEVMNFCAEKNIKPIIELVSPNRIDEIFDVLQNKNDSVVRYVIDFTK